MNYTTMAVKEPVSPTETAQFNLRNLPFPIVESPFFQSFLQDASLTAKQVAMLSYYRKNGYLIVDEPIVDEQESLRIIDHVKAHTPKSENRLQDAWRESQNIRNLACHETILSALRLLYGREPVPFQTLNFIRGTQQRTHSDAIHFSSLPARFMCGVWTALEDITIKQGPLHYYPESHTLPELDYYDLGIAEEHIYPEAPHEGELNWKNPRTMAKYKLYEELVSRLVKDAGYKKEALTLKRGQSLIWASNIFHGGEPILDPSSTRHSQVTHFHFDGVVPYTPMFSNARLNAYFLPALVNVRTGEKVERSYNFAPVDLSPLAKTNLYQIHLRTGQVAAPVEGYHEELARLKAELEYQQRDNAMLRETLAGLQGSVVMKAIQPFQKLVRSLR